MQNVSLDLLQLEGLKVGARSSVPAFVLLILIYVFIVVSNLGLVLVIARGRSLQRPMYLLFCNMSVNDVFGASAVLPRLLADILVPPSRRLITYGECALQAFCAHFHAGTSHTVLLIMAFDRYLAVCAPLRYAGVMTRRKVAQLSAAAWSAAFVSVAVLVGLSARLSRCRRQVRNPFCDNASLFKLSCDDLLVNHAYGLGSAALLLGASLGGVALTYLRIAIACWRNRKLGGRALHTCATHLAVYLLMLVASFTPMIMHRRQDGADGGKVASVLFHVVPTAANPLIYGLNCKELRRSVRALLQRNTHTH